MTNQPPPWDQGSTQPGYGQYPQTPGNYPPPPYGQQPYPPQPGPAQPPPGRRKHTARNISIGAGAVLVAIIAISAANSHGSPEATPAASTTTAPASPPAAAAPRTTAPAAKPRTVATFTGSGTETTRKFTVTGTWKLTYKFSCADFGQAGNFAVDEDGGADFNGVTVNDLAMSKSGSTWAYSDAGTHYLGIDSECSWTVKVTDEP